MKPLFVLVVSTACIFGVSGHPQAKIVTPKIVGGQPVNIEDFPYMIQLILGGEFQCGGSIISPDWIISAAHCTYNFPGPFSIRAGTSLKNQGGVLLQIKHIYNHPQFIPKFWDNDICVIELAESLRFGPTINKISLPQPYEEVPAGSTALVSGWGLLFSDGSTTDRLQAARIPIIDANKCKKLYFPSPITSGMICAGAIEGIGSCKGDSGGPLAYNGVLIGIVSWGRGICTAPNQPSVYAKVSQFRTFIAEITGI